MRRVVIFAFPLLFLTRFTALLPVIIAVFGFLPAAVCDTGTNGGGTGGSQIRVYVAGSYYDAGGTTACYWTDGVRTDLTVPGCSSEANGITVSDGVVYAAGLYWDDHYTRPTACYWKDGVRTDLVVPEYYSQAYGITLSGGAVYVAGDYFDGSSKIPCYWKDGVKIDLTAVPEYPSYAYAIIISDGVVYAAGAAITARGYNACYWKDGARTVLAVPGYSSRAAAIAVVEE